MEVDFIAVFVEEPSPLVEILTVATDSVPGSEPGATVESPVLVYDRNVRNVCRVCNLMNRPAKIDILGIKEESLVEPSDACAEVGPQHEERSGKEWNVGDALVVPSAKLVFLVGALCPP